MCHLRPVRWTGRIWHSLFCGSGVAVDQRFVCIFPHLQITLHKSVLTVIHYTVRDHYTVQKMVWPSAPLRWNWRHLCLMSNADYSPQALYGPMWHHTGFPNSTSSGKRFYCSSIMLHRYSHDYWWNLGLNTSDCCVVKVLAHNCCHASLKWVLHMGGWRFPLHCKVLKVSWKGATVYYKRQCAVLE